MTDDQDPWERALDVALFAPLGLALSAKELLPKLVDKGRQQIGGQVALARMVGGLAMNEGRKRAGQVLDPMIRQAEQAFSQWGMQWAKWPGGGDQVQPAADRHTPTAGTGDRTADSGGGPAPGTAATTAPGDDERAAPLASELPIPGYDTLSASQVVQRLDGLSSDELEAVRAYEEASRARKTVLSRVSQLKSAS